MSTMTQETTGGVVIPAVDAAPLLLIKDPVARLRAASAFIKDLADQRQRDIASAQRIAADAIHEAHAAGLTNQDLATDLGLSRERIRQIGLGPVGPATRPSDS